MTKRFFVKLFVSAYRIILFLLKFTLLIATAIWEIIFTPEKKPKEQPNFYYKQNGDITYDPNHKDRVF